MITIATKGTLVGFQNMFTTGTTDATWVEGSDVITGEYRGPATLERYLDTSNTSIPDYATATSPAPIDNYYKFRVVETKQFNP